MTRLVLYEPDPPGADWAPFGGVRPIAELTAGAWPIRRRWESALGLATHAILAPHVEGFYEEGVPSVLAAGPVTGPAIVAASTFAPATDPLTIAEDTRRVVAADGATVAWVVPAGATWAGPDQSGPALEIGGNHLRGSYDLLDTLGTMLAEDCLRLADEPATVPPGAVVFGDPAWVVTRGAEVEPGVVFDVRHGAVVVEPGASVRHGTRLEGPLFVGRETVVLGGSLRHSAFGPQCRVRGEVSNVIFLGYGNKAHDGFVGHSVLGRWVNLGAMTTTSNLKNTYGPVRLEVAGHRLETGRQLLGSLIGDHAKTAIGTLLPTGTIVGVGANLFGSAPVPKFVPPFAWGNGASERLRREGFLAIAQRVFPRRGIVWSPAYEAALGAMYDRVVG